MRRRAIDVDLLVGSVLIGGVLSSLGLLAAGLAWHWWQSGMPGLAYDLRGETVLEFILSDVVELRAGPLRPRLLVNLGLAVLLLTPYARVLASTLYFGAVVRNWKYTLFTAFVLGTLSYSLFASQGPSW